MATQSQRARRGQRPDIVESPEAQLAENVKSFVDGGQAGIFWNGDLQDTPPRVSKKWNSDSARAGR
jgi:hypothetical protein